MKPTISVIGTGRMGAALVRALLKHEYRTEVWNRTVAKAQPLAALGARLATTVHDAVSAADIVVVNVTDYATAHHLLRPGDVTRDLRGKLVVQLTSGTPKQAKDMAAWARQHDITYLDGAIMATPNFIGEAGCTILYSGPSDSFTTHKPVFLALGGNALYLGSDVGHASALDNALLVVLWATLFGVLQGVSICEAEKFPLDAYLSSLTAMMPVVDASSTDLVDRIGNGRFAGDETTAATVDTCRASIRYLLELSKEHGIRHAMLDAFDQVFQAAVAAGHAQDDLAVLKKFIR